jgi:SPP1 family predicted phage head-tail adaptor
MPRNIGKMNRRITILKPTPGRDSSGTPTTTFQALRSEWASIVQPTGRATAQGITADRESSPVAYSIRINYCTDVTAAMRVTCEGVTYNVMHVIPDVARRNHTDLVCVMGAI